MQLKTFFNEKLNTKFSKDLFVLVLGTTIAQAIPLLFAPLLSRLFSVEDFSILGLYISVYSILSIALSARYEGAIILSKKEAEAKSLIFISIFFAFILSLLFTILFLIFNHQIAQLLKNNAIEFWLCFVPFSAFMLSINNILINWFNRKRQYKKISVNKIVKNTINITSNLGFGLLKIKTAGLLISQIISDTATSLIFLFKFLKKDFNRKNIPSIVSAKKTLRAYKDFPLFSLPTSFIDTLSNQLPILLVSGLFTSELSGYYFFSIRLLAFPISLIGAAYGQIFFERLVGHVNKFDFKGAKRLMINSWKFLFSMIIIPSIIIFFWGENIFTTIFGQKWLISGQIASILIIYIMFAFISSPTSATFIAFRIQKYSLFFGILVLIYRVSALLIGFLFKDFFIAIKILVFFEVAEIIIYNLVALKKVNNLIQNSSIN